MPPPPPPPARVDSCLNACAKESVECGGSTYVDVETCVVVVVAVVVRGIDVVEAEVGRPPPGDWRALLALALACARCGLSDPPRDCDGGRAPTSVAFDRVCAVTTPPGKRGRGAAQAEGEREGGASSLASVACSICSRFQCTGAERSTIVIGVLHAPRKRKRGQPCDQRERESLATV